MLTKEEMLEYLITPEISWYEDVLKNKSYEELTEIYNRSKLTDEIMQDMISNGVTTYRINYRSDREQQKELIAYMKQNNMYCIYDGRIDWNIHVGNYCIVGIPEQFIKELKNKYPDFIYSVDLKKTTLSKKDIEGLKEGDKVKILAENMLGGLSQSQGTIYKISDYEIVVKAYRSKTKGYRLTIGKPGSIEKILKFNVG